MSGFVFALPAAGFYLFGAFRQWRTVKGDQPNRSIVMLAGMVALLLHLGYIGTSMAEHAQLNFALGEVVSLITWVMALLLIASSLKKPVDNLFIALFPVVAVSVVLAALSSHYVPLTSPDVGLSWHILLALMAYSVFSIATVQAVLLYLQDLHLHKRQLNRWMNNLPPLQTMDLLLFEMIWLGMGLLTIALAIGFPYISSLEGQQITHKVVLGTASWLVFAILLAGRYLFGWRGLIASRWTIIGSTLLLLAYLGSEFVLQYLLGHA